MTHLSTSASKTRPADTTAYSVNDVVSNSTSAGTVWSFAGFPGSGGYLVKARVASNLVTGMTPRLRLYLFNAAPTGVLNDNAANTEPVYADESWKVGLIDFDAMDNSMAGADSSESQRDDLRLEFSGHTLSGVLVTLDAFTPASEQKFTITLVAEV